MEATTRRSFKGNLNAGFTDHGESVSAYIIQDHREDIITAWVDVEQPKLYLKHKRETLHACRAALDKRHWSRLFECYLSFEEY